MGIYRRIKKQFVFGKLQKAVHHIVRIVLLAGMTIAVVLTVWFAQQQQVHAAGCTPPNCYSISGNIYNDINKNQRYNPPGETFFSNSNGSITVQDSTLTTVWTQNNVTNSYTTGNILPPGTYTVAYSNLPSGYDITYPLFNIPPTYTLTLGRPDCTNDIINCNSCSAQANTCSANNGTQSCTHDTLANGSTNCNQVTFSQSCSRDNCSTGYTCTGGSCTLILNDCTSGAANCGSCSAPTNTCSNGNGTQTCTHDQTSPCKPVMFSRSCTIDNCSGNETCAGGQCILCSTPSNQLCSWNNSPACTGSYPVGQICQCVDAKFPGSDKQYTCNGSNGSWDYQTDVSQSCSQACNNCLSADTVIATPKGNVKVTDLKVGMVVWTITEKGKKIPAPILKLAKTPVTSTHPMVHFVLADGKELYASFGHPTSDGRLTEKLQVGDVYSGSVVVRTEIVMYQYPFTYDLLPASDTGYYFANGILMGSTLKK